MATVATITARLPAWMQARYGSTYIINWINELLEECSGEPGLFKEIRLETGAVVDNYNWIDKPSGCREIFGIYNPQARSQRFNWVERNGRIFLDNAYVEAETSPDTASAFSNYDTEYIDVDIDDATEDEYANYLFLITAGTYAGVGYVIDENDASAGGTCRLYFQHELAVALDGTKVTAASLIHPAYYVLIDYTSSFDSVSLTTDEVPINDKYERRLLQGYLEWRSLLDTDPSSRQTKDAEKKYRRTLMTVKRELRNSTGGRIKPRLSPGFYQYTGRSGSYPKSYQEDL